MTLNNAHVPNKDIRQRVSDLAIAGIPKGLIAKIVKMDEVTLQKYYDYELSCAQPECVERIAKVLAIQAQEGDIKAMTLYLKTQAAKFGWVEKQVVENVNAEDTLALKDKIKELEGKFDRDY